MSRWIDAFNTHAFHSSWKDLKEKLNVAEVDNTQVEAIEELARLKKSIAFIDI